MADDNIFADLLPGLAKDYPSPSDDNIFADLLPSPAPPRPPEPGPVRRAIDFAYDYGVHPIMRFAGAAKRGLDTSANLAIGALQGDPLAEFSLTPESAPPFAGAPAMTPQKRGIGGDVASALGLAEPTTLSPSLGQQVGKGVFGAPSEDDGYGRAIGRAATTFVADIATDPLTYTGLGAAKGPLTKVLGPGGAQVAEKVAHRAFQLGMAKGAAESGKAAYDTYIEQGFTPEAAAEMTEALLNALALGATFAGGKRGPRAIDAEVVPPGFGFPELPPGPAGLPPAGGFRPSGQIIDVEATPVQRQFAPVPPIEAEVVPRRAIDFKPGAQFLLPERAEGALAGIEDAVQASLAGEPGAPRLGSRLPPVSPPGEAPLVTGSPAAVAAAQEAGAALAPTPYRPRAIERPVPPIELTTDQPTPLAAATPPPDAAPPLLEAPVPEIPIEELGPPIAPALAEVPAVEAPAELPEPTDWEGLQAATQRNTPYPVDYFLATDVIPDVALRDKAERLAEYYGREAAVAGERRPGPIDIPPELEPYRKHVQDLADTLASNYSDGGRQVARVRERHKESGGELRPDENGIAVAPWDESRILQLSPEGEIVAVAKASTDAAGDKHLDFIGKDPTLEVRTTDLQNWLKANGVTRGGILLDAGKLSARRQFDRTGGIDELRTVEDPRFRAGDPGAVQERVGGDAGDGILQLPGPAAGVEGVAGTPPLEEAAGAAGAAAGEVAVPAPAPTEEVAPAPDLQPAGPGEAPAEAPARGGRGVRAPRGRKRAEPEAARAGEELGVRDVPEAGPEPTPDVTPPPPVQAERPTPLPAEVKPSPAPREGRPFAEPEPTSLRDVTEATLVRMVREGGRNERKLAINEMVRRNREDVPPIEAPPAKQESTPAEVKAEAAKVEPEPTPAQKEAGNYKKGHIKWGGLEITIENAKGSPREAADGSWRVEKMPANYGYIRGTKGKDGDQVDVYYGPKPSAKNVFVIDQVNAETRAFDEHKAMIGFESQQQARETYYKGFSDEKGPQRFGAMTIMSPKEFRTWLDSGNTKQALKPKQGTRPRPAPSDPRTRPVTPQLEEGVGGPDAKYVLPSFATAGAEKKPKVTPVTETEPTKAEAKGEEKAREPGRVGAGETGGIDEPDLRPKGRDQEPLEAVPAEEVRGAEAGRPAGEGDRGGVPKDKASVRGGDRKRPRAEPGVGAGEGALGPPAGGERSGIVGDVEAARPLKEAVKAVQAAKPTDFRIRESDEIGGGSPREKVQGNFDAIELAQKLEKEGRHATPEEQAVLAKYVGWGAFPQLFTPNAPDYYQPQWREPRAKLDELLQGEDYRAAKASTINAHFTSPKVISAMWDAAQRLGVRKGASVLEPAMGVGSFFGLQPERMLPASRTGVELDRTTALIAKHLYPNAAVFQKGLQETKLPENHYGVVISNVPFANVGVHDPAFSKHPEVLKSVHDYFFAKGLRLTKPGGLMAAITSHYTMDKMDPRVREYISSQADFLGAIRLPRTAFKSNAGTEVVTDIIFLRKRAPGEGPGGEAWLKSEKLEELEGKKGEKGSANVNEYFLANPHMVLGKHTLEGSMYGPQEYTVSGDLETEALAAAVKKLPRDALRTVVKEAPTAEEVVRSQVGFGDQAKQGAFAVRDGKLVVREGEFYKPAEESGLTAERIRGQVGIRDVTRRLLDAQLEEGTTDAQLKKLQEGLGDTYDAYVKKHGPLSVAKNSEAFDEDPDAPLLLALENYDPDTKKAEKAAIFKQRTIATRRRVAKAANAIEALPIVLSEYGALDMRRMMSLTGKKSEAILKELGDLAYINPEGEGVETADEYLSGNVRQKLAVARSAAKADSTYSRNVKALEKAQPEELAPSQIHVRLGSPWVPTDTIAEFVADTLGSYAHNVDVAHATEIGSWSLNARGSLAYSAKATDEWGTPDANAVDLIEDALNMREPAIRRKQQDGSSILDQAATIAAKEKQRLLQEEFRRWLWADEARAASLTKLYNETQNTTVAWVPDGSHLEFPGMAKLVLRNGDLEPHQKNGAWRIIRATPKTNVALNHAVGAGKTYEVIAAIMEMRRLGTVQKAIVSVPKHLVAQWATAWLNLYPNATVLKVDAKSMTPEKRGRLMAKMATGTYDAIIMSFESLGKLPVKKETFEAFLNQQIAELEAAVLRVRAEEAEGGGRRQDSRIVKDLEKRIERLKTKIKDYVALHTKDVGVSFEDLGADVLMVDEAHAFKRLDVPSKLQVRGIAQGGSNRAMDLFMKSRHTNNRGGKLIFATATPVTNTMGEAYIVQRFLQPELLKERGIEHFDAWAASFGDIVSSAEMDATGKYKPISRFARFVNVPELAAMMGQTMDTKLAEDLNLPAPEVEGGKPQIHVAPPSKWLTQYVVSLGERSDRVRSRSVDPREDNMLKITTDGRKAATDMRLIDPNIPDDPNSKINLAAGNVGEIFKKTRDRRATQVVFLDLGTPKDGKATAVKEAEPADTDPAAEAATGTVEEERLNETLYADLRKKIVKSGVPDSQIAFIHDAKTDVQKEQLQRRVNSGAVAVLIGSTGKMGTGLNVQERLSALHLISPPMRPDQVEQAIGRIVRQGNMHHGLKIPVQLHFYATEGSYDAVLYQMLETKQRFVNDFMRAKVGQRVIEDTGTVELTYAQAKAIASGDPRIIEKTMVDANVSKLSSLRRSHEDASFRRRQKLGEYEGTIRWSDGRIASAEADLAKYQKAKPEDPADFSMTVGEKKYTDRTKAGEALIAAAQAAKKGEPGKPKSIGEYLGFPVDVSWWVAEKGLASKLTVGDYSANLSEVPVGTVQSLHYALGRIEDVLKDATDVKAKAEKNLRDAKALVGKPFDKQAELDSAMKRQRELSEALSITKGEEAAGGGEGGQPPEPPKPGGPAQFFDGDEALRRLRDSGKGKAHDLGSAAAAGAGVLRDLGIYAASVLERLTRAAAGKIPNFGLWAKNFAKGVAGVVRGFGPRLRSFYRQAISAFSRQQRAAGQPPGAAKAPPTPPTSAPKAAGWRPSVPEETLLRRVQRIVQDRLNRIGVYEKAVREQGGTVREQLKDLFDAVTPKVAERIQEAQRLYIDPLVEHLAKNKISMKEFHEYLYAKHAPKRNQVISGRRGQQGDWSGMTDAEAARIIDRVKDSGRTQVFEQGADFVRQMRDKQIEILKEGGLLSDAQAEAWRDTMGDDYVPLRTAEVEEGIGTGQGFDIRGKEAKAATGRVSPADNVVAAMAQQLMRAIARAEKNKADQAFADFARENNLFEIDKQYVEWEMGPNGQVRRSSLKEAARAQEDFSYKVDGQTHRIDIGSVDPILDRAMKNLSAKETGKLVETIGKLTRIYSQLVTSWNPEFILTNLLRDLQTAGVNVTAEQSAGIAAEMTKSIPKAMKGMWDSLKDPNTATPWAKAAKEFRENGGSTGWFSIKGLKELEAELNAKVKRAGPGFTNAAFRLGRGFVGWVEGLNKSVESGVRLAFFKALRDKGVSAKDAASAARKVTIDFNKKGEMGPVMNSLYAFFNANVQGAVRLGQVLATKKGAAIAGGLVTFAWALDQRNRAMATDSDKDGTNDYDQIPEYVKERNMVFMRGPGEKPFLVPLPYGFNVLHSVGHQAGAIMAGATTPGKAAMAVGASLTNAFNPLGSDAGLVQTLSPTMLDPLVQHSMNQDFTGRKLRPENYPGGRQKPDSELYFKNVNPWARDFAAGLNRLTGGDRVTSGLIDVSPETLEHFFSFSTGGLGKFVGNVAATGRALAEGKLPDARNVPFGRRLLFEARPGQIDTERIRESYYDAFGNEDLRHAMAEADYSPAPPARELRVRGQSVELTPEEYRIFVEADRKMAARLKHDVRDPRYRRMDDERKRAFLSGRFRIAGEDARRKVLRAVARRARA